MYTQDVSKGIQNLNKNTQNVSFKTNYRTHYHIQDIITKTGQPQQSVLNMLIDKGIDQYILCNKSEYDDPKIRLYSKVKLVQEANRIRDMLSCLKHRIPEADFKTLCQDLGEDPEDYLEIPEPDNVVTKHNRCERFLEILFIDRPDGLPGTRVIEIAVEHGFGKNMTRESAGMIGLTFVKQEHQGNQKSMWIPEKN